MSYESATCPRCGSRFMRATAARWKRLCFPCWRAARTSPRPPAIAPPPIPADVLRRLLLLCHPDRHGGSAAATEATRWLLEQRRATGPNLKE